MNWINSFIDVILSEGVSKSKLCQIFSFYPSLLVNMKLKQGVMKNIELFIRFFTYFFCREWIYRTWTPFPSCTPRWWTPCSPSGRWGSNDKKFILDHYLKFLLSFTGFFLTKMRDIFVVEWNHFSRFMLKKAVKMS